MSRGCRGCNVNMAESLSPPRYQSQYRSSLKMRLLPLTCLQHLPHDRAGLFRLPGAVRLSQRARPLDVQVHPGPECGSARQDTKRQLEDAALHARIIWHAKGVAERKLHTHADL